MSAEHVEDARSIARSGKFGSKPHDRDAANPPQRSELSKYFGQVGLWEIHEANPPSGSRRIWNGEVVGVTGNALTPTEFNPTTETFRGSPARVRGEAE